MLATHLSRPAVRKTLLLCCFAACAVSAGAEPSRELEIGTQLFPPYVVDLQGRASGPMVDVLNAACRNLGWTCNARIYPWRRAIDLMERAEIDGLFPVLDVPSRRERMWMSVPVVDGRYVFFSRRGVDFAYRGPESLLGHEIGVFGPSGTSMTLQDLAAGAPAKIRLERDNLVALKMLAAGRYGEHGLVFANEQVALWLLASNAMTGLQSSGGAKDIYYVYGLTRRRVSVTDFAAFDEALKDLCRTGQTAELVKPYGVPVSACAPVRR